MQNKVYEKYEEVQAVEKQMIDALETRLREDGFSLNDLVQWLYMNRLIQLIQQGKFVVRTLWIAHGNMPCSLVS